MDKLFKGLFDTEQTAVISVSDFLLCVTVSLVLGLAIAAAYSFKAKYTRSFVIALALLPAVVCVIIMTVNGNIGAGVAVAGAFGLVRFRSAPGSAEEIVTLFIAMGAGMIAGMGYLGFSVLFTLIMCVMYTVYRRMSRCLKGSEATERTVTVTVPEDLDYPGVFEEVFKEYTSKSELIKVKTHNMGSMLRLTYNITLTDVSREKELIDQLRIRNGNLEITLTRAEGAQSEL